MVGIERTRAKLPKSGSNDCSGALGVVLLFQRLEQTLGSFTGVSFGLSSMDNNSLLASCTSTSNRFSSQHQWRYQEQVRAQKTPHHHYTPPEEFEVRRSKIVSQRRLLPLTPSVSEEDDNILMQDNHTISMEHNNKTKDKSQESTPKGCLESAPSKTGVDTHVKETHVYYNSPSCLTIIRKNV